MKYKTSHKLYKNIDTNAIIAQISEQIARSRRMRDRPGNNAKRNK